MSKSSSMIALSVGTVALGAMLLVADTRSANAQEGLFTAERDCNTDIQSLCAGIKPGGGRVLACLQSHVAAGDLSVGCSTILSKAIWTAQQCAGDIRQFCPNATYSNVGDCMKPHLGQASGTCRSALAFMASPAADRY
jgi:Cysteine rich repeat